MATSTAGNFDGWSPIADEAARATRVLHPEATSLPRPEQCRILTVANQKGGVGKTTSAVNFATGLAKLGLRVLVIDLDPQGNASTALGVDHQSGTPSVYEVLLGEIGISEAVHTSSHADNLLCVPATIDLAGSEIELVEMEQRESRLKAALRDDELRELGIDFVFIDCPPSLGLLTVNALVAAREVLIPIQCEYYALEGLGQLLHNVELVQVHLNRSLSISTIVLTMYDGRTKLADQVADEVRNHFQDLVLRTIIPRSVKVSEAPGFGQSVLTYDPGCRGAMSYLDAARELATRSRAVPASSADPSSSAEPASRTTSAPTAGTAPTEATGTESEPAAGYRSTDDQASPDTDHGVSRETSSGTSESAGERSSTAEEERIIGQAASRQERA